MGQMAAVQKDAGLQYMRAAPQSIMRRGRIGRPRFNASAIIERKSLGRSPQTKLRQPGPKGVKLIFKNQEFVAQEIPKYRDGEGAYGPEVGPHPGGKTLEGRADKFHYYRSRYDVDY